MIVQYFLVDYGSGDIYKLGIEAPDRESVEKYLHTISPDVRFLKTETIKDDGSVKIKGGRKLECGVVRYCKYCPPGHRKGAEPDVRHHRGQDQSDH